jgi:hypothetical protein
MSAEYSNASPRPKAIKARATPAQPPRKQTAILCEPDPFTWSGLWAPFRTSHVPFKPLMHNTQNLVFLGCECATITS